MLNTIVIMAGTFQNVNSFFKKIIFYFCDSSPEARTETLCLDDDIKEKQKQKKGGTGRGGGVEEKGKQRISSYKISCFDDMCLAM